MMKILSATVVVLLICKVTWGLPFDKSEAPNLFKAQWNCLHSFSAQINSIADKTKINSQKCVNEADVRFRVNEKVNLIQKLMTNCWDYFAADYFACVQKSDDEIKKFRTEIDLISEIYLKNDERIQQKKRTCLKNTSEEGKIETAKTQNELNLCLQRIPQPDSKKDMKQVETPLPNDMNEFLEIVDKVKEKYENLKTCVSFVDYNTCWKEADLFSSEMNLRRPLVERFSGNSSVYFSKITEIDLAGDSCIRQYIAKQLERDFQYDLEGCLKNGRSAIEVSEDNSEKDKKLIENLIEIQEQFKTCRKITKHLKTYDCAMKIMRESILIKELQREISILSEKKFNKLKEILRFLYAHEYPCIDGFYSILRFKGLDVNGIGLSVERECILLGYKGRGRAPITKEEIIADLQPIQDYLKNCAKHPESPGFEICFSNALWTYNQGILPYFHRNIENYKKIIEESDSTNHTCFGKILGEERRFYDRDRNLKELENCVLSYSK